MKLKPGLYVFEYVLFLYCSRVRGKRGMPKHGESMLGLATTNNYYYFSYFIIINVLISCKIIIIIIGTRMGARELEKKKK